MGKLIPVLAKYSAYRNFFHLLQTLSIFVNRKKERSAINPYFFNREIKKSRVIFSFDGTKIEYIQKHF